MLTIGVWKRQHSSFQRIQVLRARLRLWLQLKSSSVLPCLKYARYARGGRLDPSSISPIIDRQPHIFEPKSVLEGIAAAVSADAYLRGLHPKHEQFKRLRQALLALNKAGQRRFLNSGAGARISGRGTTTPKSL